MALWRLRFTDFASSPEVDFQYLYAPDGTYLATASWMRGLGIETVAPFSMTQEQAATLLSSQHLGEFDQLYLAQPVVADPEPIYYFCMVATRPSSASAPTRQRCTPTCSRAISPVRPATAWT